MRRRRASRWWEKEQGRSFKEALAHARESISGGMAELLSRRKKLIKLADRLEAGWAFVEEYIEDDLADNLDDERRIEKTEKAAERKLAKRKRERDAGMKRGIAQPTAGRMDTQLPDGKRLQRWGKEHSSLVPFSRAAPGACHQCGEFGHWRRECPQRVPTAAATYPLSLGDACCDMQGTSQASQVVRVKVLIISHMLWCWRC